MNKITKNTKFIFLLAIFCPVILVFSSIFTNSSLSRGDAPYFIKENITAFISEPQAWTERGIALGGINQFVWIAPLMFIISLVQKISNLDSAVLIRLFFYIPSIILSITGAFQLSLSFGLSKKAAFGSSLIAVINTHFILLFDGGQVGVLLAYGLFPWALLFLKEFVNEKTSSVNFTKALLLLLLTTVADPRISILSLFACILLSPGKIKKLFLITIPWIFINLYWLVPLISLKGDQGSLGTVLQSTSFLNGLFLYSPHWPQNVYGLVTYPNLLFVVFPLIVFVNLFFNFKYKRQLLLSYLVFVFLVKGTSDPIGKIYEELIRLPFGSAFRDSTKFFIPLIYITGALFGNGVDILSKKLKLMSVAVYILIIVPFYPTYLRKMNFVMSGQESNKNVVSVNEIIKGDESFGRSAWFTERDPRSFENSLHPSFDAKDLINLRVFSRINAGDTDLFNFLNNNNSSWWMDMLGIKYLVLAGNPREVTPSEGEQKDWDRLNALFSNSNTYQKINTDPLTYINNSTLPKIYGVNKLFIVVGSDDIYEQILKRHSDFKPYNFGFAFVEDGRLNPKEIINYDPSSIVIINNKKDNIDLTMSMLQDSFYGSDKADISQFAIYKPDQYLKYKYELLIRKVDFLDFDYNKGISFSTVKNERIDFPITLTNAGKYKLSIRSMSLGEGLKVTVDNNESMKTTREDVLSWTQKEMELSSGNHNIVVENLGGLSVVNVISLVENGHFVKAQQMSNDLLGKFSNFTEATLPDSLFKDKWENLLFAQKSSTRYVISPTSNTRWIVFTSNFNKGWNLTRDTLSFNSLPFYSSINGLYRRKEWDELTLEFTKQKSVRWGAYFSAIAILATAIVLIWNYSKK